MAVGDQLMGRYRLTGQLVVSLPSCARYRATDRILNREVDVYLIWGDRVQEAVDAARRAALVDDPRLARVIDAGSYSGTWFILTSPADGVSLADLGPVPAAQARAIAGEAATALQVAAERDVHHLALRPENIALGDGKSLTILGLAWEAALRGIELDKTATALLADARGLVAVLYSALTARWPGDVPSQEPGPPVWDGQPVAPIELVSGVPGDLNTLCSVTLAGRGLGPSQPAEVVSDLGVWPTLEVPMPLGLGPSTTLGALSEFEPLAQTEDLPSATTDLDVTEPDQVDPAGPVAPAEPAPEALVEAATETEAQAEPAAPPQADQAPDPDDQTPDEPPIQALPLPAETVAASSLLAEATETLAPPVVEASGENQLDQGLSPAEPARRLNDVIEDLDRLAGPPGDEADRFASPDEDAGNDPDLDHELAQIESLLAEARALAESTLGDWVPGPGEEASSTVAAPATLFQDEPSQFDDSGLEPAAEFDQASAEDTALGQEAAGRGASDEPTDLLSPISAEETVVDLGAIDDQTQAQSLPGAPDSDEVAGLEGEYSGDQDSFEEVLESPPARVTRSRINLRGIMILVLILVVALVIGLVVLGQAGVLQFGIGPLEAAPASSAFGAILT